MSYSIISILALILNLIINHETLKILHMRPRELKTGQKATFRYGHFLMVANLYFLTDIAWGILYEYHEREALGHVAGDEYIKNSAMLLCGIFEHSPVFRVGGDEFVVFLRGNDYTNRVELMNVLRGKVMDHKLSGNGPIIASGMATYDSKSDTLVSEIFDRADKEMYDNKQKLKKET